MSTAGPSAHDAAIRPWSRAAIANTIVRLHAEYAGRGPTRARAHLAEDHVLVVLEDVFTTAERSLLRSGQGGEVKALRKALVEAMRGPAVAAIQDLTGRGVRAYISETHLDPELAVELFLLEPAKA